MDAFEKQNSYKRNTKTNVADNYADKMALVATYRIGLL